MPFGGRPGNPLVEIPYPPMNNRERTALAKELAPDVAEAWRRMAQRRKTPAELITLWSEMSVPGQ